jgi:hypothetical protein
LTGRDFGGKLEGCPGIGRRIDAGSHWRGAFEGSESKSSRMMV